MLVQSHTTRSNLCVYLDDSEQGERDADTHTQVLLAIVKVNDNDNNNGFV